MQFETKGITAGTYQHEVDHLDMKLFSTASTIPLPSVHGMNFSATTKNNFETKWLRSLKSGEVDAEL